MLTKIEKEILVDSANGKMVKQIANKRGSAEITIYKHLASIREKLNSKTTSQSIAKAFKYGLISARDILLLIVIVNSSLSGVDMRRARVRVPKPQSRQEQVI